MLFIGKEATDFVRACEAIHALLAIRRLTIEEHDLIEMSGNELLGKAEAGVASSS